ncbi:MAG: diaminopimelate epimerase [Candidatus Zixiibacteriota bacterium]
MSKVHFTKYDAAGNTFLVISTQRNRLDHERYSRLAKRLCDPLDSVGADGLLTIRPTGSADFALDVFNADGSWAERSGNGIRAAVAHALERRPRKKHWTIACQREKIKAEVVSRSTKRTIVRAQIGVPAIQDPRLGLIPEEPELSGQGIEYLQVSIGNPHLVIPVSSFPSAWVKLAGEIASFEGFAGGMNVEFVRRISRSKIQVRVYERGVGQTASSGTGAAAALVALRHLGQVNEKVTVDFGSQKLTVSWPGPVRRVTVTGPALRLFDGEEEL